MKLDGINECRDEAMVFIMRPDYNCLMNACLEDVSVSRKAQCFCLQAVVRSGGWVIFGDVDCNLGKASVELELGRDELSSSRVAEDQEMKVQKVLIQ